MKLTLQKYSAYTNYKGDTIDIIGEVFDEPVKENISVLLHTRIQILHKKIEVGSTLYFAEKLNYEDLQKNVDDVTKNITKYLN